MKIVTLCAALGISTVLSAASASEGCPQRYTVAENLIETASNVATADQPAMWQLAGESGPDGAAMALELTVRPTQLVKDAPYLVRVFASAPRSPSGNPTELGKLLGTFSLFGAQEGKAQSFVVNAPDPAFSSAGQPVELTVQIISANRDRDLGASALEVVSARLIK